MREHESAVFARMSFPPPFHNHSGASPHASERRVTTLTFLIMPLPASSSFYVVYMGRETGPSLQVYFDALIASVCAFCVCR